MILFTEGGCLVPGGGPGLGVSGLGGVPGLGDGGDPPRWLLLQAVRILLECILVSKKKGH